MLAAERHSRWGIGVLSLVLALVIHLFFLFGFKIEPSPIGSCETGSVLTWITIPKQTKSTATIKKIYWNVEIKGPLSKYILFPESESPEAEKVENINKFRIEIPKNKKLPTPVRAVIFEIAIPDGKKVFSIIRSSGNADFDSAAADFINSFPIKAIPSKEKNKNTRSLVTITCEPEKQK
jgi:hypothetical protein